jgi:PAS domain-containing protein
MTPPISAAVTTHPDLMFDLAPVSLWLEDYSALKRLFDGWRAEGISDLRAHLRADPARIASCSHSIRILKVNRRTLDLYAADSLDELVARLPEVFRDDMLDQHVEELAQLWEGRRHFESRSVNYALDGRRIEIQLGATVLPGHEADWSRVLLAIEDITERNAAQRAIAASEDYARGLFEHSPVSLWVEDFSVIKSLLDELREQGISDFRTFVDVHPEFVERCLAEIRVIDVNRQTLSMFGAPDKPTLLRSLGRVFRDEMANHFKEQLIELWQGKLLQQRETVNYSLGGETVNVLLQFSVLPGHEARWDLVLVSLTDITARKKAEAYLEFLGKHDVLTKLRNRSFFNDELVRLERRGPWPITVLVADLNGLKGVNDEGGHAGGDALQGGRRPGLRGAHRRRRVRAAAARHGRALGAGAAGPHRRAGRGQQPVLRRAAVELLDRLRRGPAGRPARDRAAPGRPADVRRQEGLLRSRCARAAPRGGRLTRCLAPSR